ncbi:MAG: kynureninase [Xanthomonadales bacterium]|nr:kynureninase [Xanthomonadales bacterium]|tara:strand:+ start:520 stop:1758 length:1239 start_codon:yes stop_codon:yes gene_type:complete
MKPAQFRHRFAFPRHGDGHGENGQKIYFCGNSLGLMPDTARTRVEHELERWAELAVDGHFNGDPAWLGYHRTLEDALMRLAGAKAGEVVAMGALTMNLHLLMTSFYRPKGARRKILIEKGAFPSDRYAVASQILLHGLDPSDDLVEFEPGADGLIDDVAVADFIAEHADELALVMWPGVQYATGQRFDMARICRAARDNDVPVGLDLAHAMGNVPLALHEWGADFAAWCSYKYLNAGPGAVAGIFVHERHAEFSGPRLAGWWGHDESTRFLMGPDFEPIRGAEGWQVSGAPVLNLAALAGALDIYREADIDSLQDSETDLAERIAGIVDALPGEPLEIVTPLERSRRGCQLSLRVRAGREQGRAAFEALQAAGVVGDWREPDIIRVAPNPLYNSIEDVDRFGAILERSLGRS